MQEWKYIEINDRFTLGRSKAILRTATVNI